MQFGKDVLVMGVSWKVRIAASLRPRMSTEAITVRREYPDPSKHGLIVFDSADFTT
ncbi:hypothetical protein ES702_03412 [subsurface metagenome]